MGVIEEIIEVINSSDSFVLSTHLNPEGDAIGSEVGLALALAEMGKKVSIVNVDPVPEFLHFLPGTDMITQTDTIEEPHDVFIVLDCEPERTGIKNHGSAPVKKVVNIDHHITNPKTSDVNWVDDEAAATGEMVYDLLVAMDWPIDNRVATNLYTAIFTDTGSFRYSNTDEAALMKAGRLLNYGVNPWKITEEVYETKSFRRMKLLGLVLAGIEMTDDGRVAWVTVTEEDFEISGGKVEDIDGFINYPRAVKGVEVAVLFREAGSGKIKVSFRSKGKVNVSRLAASLGGGGHPNAAGAVMEGSIDDVRDKVINIVSGLVDKELEGG